MFCNSCFQPITSCICSVPTCTPNYYTDYPTLSIDTKYVIYNLGGTDPSLLTSLNLPNGSTVKLILEAIDVKLAQVNVLSTSLPYLRTSYVINTLQQFLTSVDNKLSTIESDVISSIVISSTSGNTLVNSSGLYVPASTLSVNYTTKVLSISGGSSVNLSGICCTPSSFLGDVSSDPSGAIDGNYWWNTTSSTLKIKVNGTTKTITTT